MKRDSADVGARQWEPQLGLMEQERRAADREAGRQIAGTCLIFRERAKGGAAAAEEALRERHRQLRIRCSRAVAKWNDVAEGHLTRQHQVLADAVICRVARQA